MDDRYAVPDDLIRIETQERIAYDVNGIRPDASNPSTLPLTKFRKPNVIIDINKPGEPGTSTEVRAVRITSDFLGTVRIFKKTTDNDSKWTETFDGPVAINNGDIAFPGELMSQIKIVPQDILDEDEDYFTFTIDINICGGSPGKVCTLEILSKV